MTLHIHLTYEPKEKFKKKFETLLDGQFQVTYGETIPNPKIVNYLIDGLPDRQILESCKDLKSVIIPYAGVSHQARDLMLDYPTISLHNIHHNVIPVAEHALGLLLAVAKQILMHDRTIRTHDWSTRYASNASIQLAGKTVLILGYGHIGRYLAKILQIIGMHIMATRNTIEVVEKDQNATIYPAKELHFILPNAEVLINILPLTPETENIISTEELALLPQGALLVNVGRGKVINQQALYEALRSGHLGGAGIDVWYNYPTDEASRSHTPPSEYPFHELENVVMSPHRAGGVYTDSTENLRMENLAALLNHAAHGEPLPNRVDLSKGY